jgi:hypothetical protein
MNDSVKPNNSGQDSIDEPIKVMLTRLENEHKLAMRGLVGVLTAAVIGLLIVCAIVVLAMLLPIYVPKEAVAVQITGTQFVIIVVALLICVAGNVFLYGAFVYNRLAKVEADLKEKRGSATIR